MAGMVSGLDRKNCWTIAEHRGAATPDALQHLLARASWDADAVRDDRDFGGQRIERLDRWRELGETRPRPRPAVEPEAIGDDF